MSDLLLDVQSLVSLLQATAPVNEPKNPNVRFVEGVKLKEYISKSYRGGILSFNKETQRMLRLEESKGLLPSRVSAEDVDALIRGLNNNTLNEQEGYPIGTVIQIVTRLLVYSLQFRRCMSSTPDDRLTSAVVAISDYKNAQLDLSNPFTTLDWRVLTNEFLERAQNVLQLTVNPYNNPTDDLKAILIGAAPFLVTGGAIQPLDTEITYVENLYRQVAGQHKSFNQASHRDSSFMKFGFKEYVRHKIPLKRVINGAYCCYMDPLGKTYYYTTLTLDPFYFKVLKNLIIYEITSGKAAYIHTALYLYLSMCTCEEDFKLMLEYGVIQWNFPMEGYTHFCEMMKELLDVMYCWKFLNTLTWHTEMVKIAHWKDKKNDTSNWNDFAVSCYSSGLLKKELDSVVFRSLAN